MLAKRIIPCLDIKEGRVVKGTSFVNLRDAGNPLELAQSYNEQSADELVFLDITASKEKRVTTIELATRLARELFIPFTIGGGINSLNEIHSLVNAGADKVSLNTAAISNPDLITEGAKRFGSQCIVVAIDARKSKINSNSSHTEDSKAKWEVFSHGGSQTTGIDAVAWAKEVEDRGAGEILGEEQSGQIFEIGYGMYTNLLSKAINQLKDRKNSKERNHIDIDAYISTLIPQDYIEDIFLRLE